MHPVRQNNVKKAVKTGSHPVFTAFCNYSIMGTPYLFTKTPQFEMWISCTPCVEIYVNKIETYEKNDQNSKDCFEKS